MRLVRSRPTGTFINCGSAPAVTHVPKQSSFSIFHVAKGKPSALSEAFGTPKSSPGPDFPKRRRSEEGSAGGTGSHVGNGLPAALPWRDSHLNH